MIATLDQKRRIVLPLPAHPGDVFDVAATPTGFQLVKLQKSIPPPVSLVVRDGLELLTHPQPVTREDVQSFQAGIDAEDAVHSLHL